MKKLLLAAALTATITPAFAAENYRTWTRPGTAPTLVIPQRRMPGQGGRRRHDDAVLRRAQPRQCRAFRPRLLLRRDRVHVALGKRPGLALDPGRGSRLPLGPRRGCESASEFDPSSLRQFNKLPRRSAFGPHAERHISLIEATKGIDVARERRDRLSRAPSAIICFRSPA
jgi:hypothetical protein